MYVFSFLLFLRCFFAHCLVIFQMLRFFDFFISSTLHPAPHPPPPDRPKFRRAHLRVAALQTPPKIPREDSQKEREREKKKRKWEREREKKREILDPPPSGPHPSSPTLPPPFRPQPLGPLLFLGLGPTPLGPRPFGPLSSGLHPSAPLPSSGGPPGLHFFWVWAPTFLIFNMLLVCSFFVHF